VEGAEPWIGAYGEVDDIRLEVGTIPGVASSTGLDGSTASFNQRWIGVGGLRYILMTSLMLETFHEALGVNIPSIGRSHRVMRDDRYDTKPLWFLASCLVGEFEERIIRPL